MFAPVCIRRPTLLGPKSSTGHRVGASRADDSLLQPGPMPSLAVLMEAQPCWGSLRLAVSFPAGILPELLRHLDQIPS